MLGVPLRGESTVSEHVPNERRVAQTKGGITSTWTFTLAPHEGGTKLDLELGLHHPRSRTGQAGRKASAQANQREADLSMENIKQRLEV